MASREGLLGPVGPLDVEVHRVIAEGDLVAVHSNYETWNTAPVDIFLNDAGKIIPAGPARAEG
jgi:predicted SnoaL-like aldol condensation-catalyzing enzyme